MVFSPNHFIAAYVFVVCLILLGLALVGIIQVPIYIFILPTVGGVDFFFMDLSAYNWGVSVRWKVATSLFYCGIVTALLSYFGVVPVPFYYFLPVVGVGAILYFKEYYHPKGSLGSGHPKTEKKFFDEATKKNPGSHSE